MSEKSTSNGAFMSINTAYIVFSTALESTEYEIPNVPIKKQAP